LEKVLKFLEALPPNLRKPLKRLDLNFQSEKLRFSGANRFAKTNARQSRLKSFCSAFFKKRIGYGATPHVAQRAFLKV
jgi:hypothetical protein